MLTYMNFWLRANLGQPQRGATMIEYVLIVALIAIVALVAIGPLGEAIKSVFSDASSELGDAVGGGGTG